ncbi:STE family protein kinase, partial [Aphelenchoides avenae]
KGYLHRDLKPANILLDANAIVKVADFGWAGRFSPNDLRFTVSGTAEYVAPETANNFFASNDANRQWVAQHPRVDCWSVGIVAKEMVEYKRPSPPNYAYSQEYANTDQYNAEVLGRVLAGQLAYDQMIQNMALPPNAEDFRGFLACCLRYDHQERWYAKDLLVHPFLQTHQRDRKSLKAAMLQRKKK